MKYMHANLKDGEDLGGGDAVVDRGDALVTDEEQEVLKPKKGEEAKKPEGEEVEGEDRKDTRIPLSRHKALLEAERAEKAQVMAKLAQYEQGQDLVKTNDEIVKAEDAVMKMEKDYATLLSDGKSDEAAALMSQIRKIERSITEMRGDLKAAAAESRAYERARYDTTVDRIEAAYPQLRKPQGDEENEDFDPALTKKVLRISRAYQQDGMPPADALQEAVKDIVGAPQTRKQEIAVEVKPRVDAAALAKAQREEAARRKNADADRRQPAAGKGVGKDSTALGGKGGDSLDGADVMKMDFNSFVKLDESTLSRLRGDIPE